MKKTILCLAFFILVLEGFSQSESPATSKEYYLKKSKTQKTVAWVMLSVGAATSITGLIIEESEVNKDPVNYFVDNKFGGTGTVMIVAGGAVALGSIPFFISSAKNKRRAAAISFNNEHILGSQQGAIVYKMQPAFSLKIQL